QTWSAIARAQEVLGRRYADRNYELPTARQPAHVCLAPRIERTEPRNRRTIARAYESDNDEAICSSGGRSSESRHRTVRVQDLRFRERRKSRRQSSAITNVTGNLKALGRTGWPRLNFLR